MMFIKENKQEKELKKNVYYTTKYASQRSMDKVRKENKEAF